MSLYNLQVKSAETSWHIDGSAVIALAHKVQNDWIIYFIIDIIL